MGPIRVPQVPIIDGTKRNGFGAVHDAAAAYSQNEVHLFFFSKGCPFKDLGIGRVAADAGKFDNGLAGCLKISHDFFIDTRFLDAAPTVGQHDLGAVLSEQARQISGDTIVSKIDFRRILKHETIHDCHLSFFLFPCFSRKTPDQRTKGLQSGVFDNFSWFISGISPS